MLYILLYFKIIIDRNVADRTHQSRTETQIALEFSALGNCGNMLWARPTINASPGTPLKF